MARGDQLARQWKIIETLLASHTGKSVAQLADDLDCSWRTVYRDLEALQAAGFPLYTDRVDGKNLWSLIDTLKHHIPIPFTLTELLAIYFSQDMLKFLQNTVFHESLESLFDKIKTTIPPESKKYLDNVQQTFQVTLKQFKEYGKYREILNTIKDAALNHKTVEMVYFTMGRRKEAKRRVDPYRILFFNGTFYVIGYCHLRKDCRTFALERIKMLTTTDKSFVVPEDFRLEDYMGSGFGVIGGRPEKIKIWFSPDIAGYIRETTWHESQAIHQQKDGSIIFEADVAQTPELISWIMSWGARAEVLEPKSLKDNIHAEALAMLKAYNETPDQEKQTSR
jgi:predicted DNA-binding transcriptional regulator YafY